MTKRKFVIITTFCIFFKITFLKLPPGWQTGRYYYYYYYYTWLANRRDRDAARHNQSRRSLSAERCHSWWRLPTAIGETDSFLTNWFELPPTPLCLTLSWIKILDRPFLAPKPKGCLAHPKRTNLRKSSKRPLTPPLIFGKSYCKYECRSSSDITSSKR